MQVRLYATATDTAAAIDDTQSVEVDQGQFTVYVPVPHDLYLDNDALFLGLSVDGQAEMTPRLPIATEPFAGRAVYADECTTLEGFGANDFRAIVDPIDWSDAPVRDHRHRRERGYVKGPIFLPLVSVRATF